MKKLMLMTVVALALVACSKENPQKPAEPAAVAPAPTATPAATPAAPEKAPAKPPAKAPAPAPAAQEAPASETATFAVPDMDAAKLQAIVGALDGADGVTAAKPDTTAGTLAVTFAPGKTNPKTLLDTVVKVAPGTTLKGVAPATGTKTPAHAGCGSCPHRQTCGGK